MGYYAPKDRRERNICRARAYDIVKGCNWNQVVLMAVWGGIEIATLFNTENHGAMHTEEHRSRALKKPWWFFSVALCVQTSVPSVLKQVETSN